MTLLSIFEWLGATPVGILIRDSTWGFAIVETIHLLALAVLGGAVLLIDLRLLGVGLRRQPVQLLARELTPWLVGGLIVMIGSGIVLVSGEAMKCYHHPAFRWKMLLLGVAIVFDLLLHRRLTGDAIRRGGPIAGGVSLALWLSVGLAGRAIGLI